MSEATHFLVSHGAPVLFAVVFLEQIGLPLPTVPWLLVAGALWAMGMMSPFVAFDTIGSALYAGCFLVLGSLFSNQLHQVATALTDFSKGALGLLAALAVAYFVFKYLQRQRLSRLPSAPVTHRPSLATHQAFNTFQHPL